jgi:hypothetical protein
MKPKTIFDKSVHERTHIRKRMANALKRRFTHVTDNQDTKEDNNNSLAIKSFIENHTPSYSSFVPLLQNNDTIKSLEQIIKDSVEKSNREIKSISSSFPLFPNTITIKERSLTFIYRTFPFVSTLSSFEISEILQVDYTQSISSASLSVILKTQNNIVHTINNFKKKEAQEARYIIEGLRFCTRKNIDTSTYEIKLLIQYLIKIGQAPADFSM